MQRGAAFDIAARRSAASAFTSAFAPAGSHARRLAHASGAVGPAMTQDFSASSDLFPLVGFDWMAANQTGYSAHVEPFLASIIIEV